MSELIDNDQRRKDLMHECTANITVPQHGGEVPVQRPDWAVDGPVEHTLDARAAIAAGEHPLAQVMADLAALADGQVYQLLTPFVPAPLVDLARGKGFLSFSVAESGDLVRTYFRKDVSAAPRP